MLLFPLSAGRCLPVAFNAQWFVVVCSRPLPSLPSPTFQRSSTIVSPAAGRRRILSLLCHWRPVPSLLFGRGRPRPRCCRRGQRRGPVGGHKAVAENQLPAGPPALAAIIVVSAARLGGGRMKPCAAPPRRPSGDAGSTTPRRRRRAVTSSVLLPLTVSIVVGIVGIIASSRRHFVVAVVTGPHNIH